MKRTLVTVTVASLLALTACNDDRRTDNRTSTDPDNRSAFATSNDPNVATASPTDKDRDMRGTSEPTSSAHSSDSRMPADSQAPSSHRTTTADDRSAGMQAAPTEKDREPRGKNEPVVGRTADPAPMSTTSDRTWNNDTTSANRGTGPDYRTATPEQRTTGNQPVLPDATNRDATSYNADNSGKNVRDRDNPLPTADSQAENANDRTIIQQVRKAVVADDTLSMKAHNVKIISIDGVVTLRGPVDNVAERQSIGTKAERITGVRRVDNLLEVAQ